MQISWNSTSFSRNFIWKVSSQSTDQNLAELAFFAKKSQFSTVMSANIHILCVTQTDCIDRNVLSEVAGNNRKRRELKRKRTKVNRKWQEINGNWPYVNRKWPEINWKRSEIHHRKWQKKYQKWTPRSGWVPVNSDHFHLISGFSSHFWLIFCHFPLISGPFRLFSSTSGLSFRLTSSVLSRTS